MTAIARLTDLTSLIATVDVGLAQAPASLETAVALPYDALPPASSNAARGLFGTGVDVTAAIVDPETASGSFPSGEGVERRALQAKLTELMNQIRELQRQLQQENEKSWPFRSEERIAELSQEIARLSAEAQKLQHEYNNSQTDDNEELLAKLAKHREEASPSVESRLNLPIFPSLPFEIAVQPFVQQQRE